jgi:hypothetical protein
MGWPTSVSTSPKGSLGLVGEFFEVRTQIYRDLTTFSRVDRRLGLIKNLGRHTDHAAQRRTVAGMASSRELAEQCRGVIPRRVLAWIRL